MLTLTRPSLLLRWAAVCCALVLGLAGCGGADSTADPPDSTAPDGAVVITISDFEYDVPETVEPGAEITIRNEDSMGHTVTSDEEGVFDVVVGAGEEVTFTVPSEAGEYPFHCTPHPNMTATLVVG